MSQRYNLTLKQKNVLEFIEERIQQNLPPTIREIARYMGFSSTGTVRDYLKALEKKGYLKRTRAYLARSIILLKSQLNKIPIISSIPAGKPDFAYEDIEGYVEWDNLLPAGITQEEVFALRVKGESMVEAGIRQGDIAIIRRQSTAINGDVIAALLDNHEVTLKRLRYKNNKAYLEAANQHFPPIYKDFVIMGKLIAILRKY